MQSSHTSAIELWSILTPPLCSCPHLRHAVCCAVPLILPRLLLLHLAISHATAGTMTTAFVPDVGS